jgi:hypothetical protein
MPYNIDDFATQIKTKYPDYKDWDNTRLAGQVISKHPEYATWLDNASYQKAHKNWRMEGAAAQAEGFNPVPETTGYQDTGGTLGFLKSRASVRKFTPEAG